MVTRNTVLLAVALFGLSACSTLKDTSKNDVKPDAAVSQTEENDIRKVISNEEKRNGIPHGILNSIAKVESRHSVYAVNARRTAHNFKTKEEAVKFVKTSLGSGCKNISVGCFQLHYATHKRNFPTIDDMFSPQSNAMYAAMLLRTLYDRYGSWETAIKKYHNGKNKHNAVYYTKVMNAYKQYVKES